jgi:hypothetical protein
MTGAIPGQKLQVVSAEIHSDKVLGMVSLLKFAKYNKQLMNKCGEKQ